MRQFMKYLSVATCAGLLLAAGMTASCKRRSLSGDAHASTNSNGRYQMAVAQLGERGTMVFMLDTREGKTWYFQPPQGALISGFWSDVPTLMLGDQYWRQVMNQMLTPQTPVGGTGATNFITPQQISPAPTGR
jgi:hypothetical protein